VNGKPSREQENATRQILRLVDLAGDLARNASDGAYARETNSEIIAVLDENIFEMFVHPFRHRESAETFYADVWSLSAQPGPEWRSFAAQAALLTSEYLISVLAPRNRGQNIYMTEFHQWELAHRVEILQEDLKQAAASQPTKYRTELSRKLRIFGDLFKDRNSAATSIRDSGDEFLVRDLERLSNDVDRPMLDRLCAARIAAQFLANAEIAEPIDQLHRVVARAIQHRLKTLESDFRPGGCARRGYLLGW